MSYRPNSDSPLDETYRDYLTRGHVALGPLDATALDELASSARSLLSCDRYADDRALANFAADCDAGARYLYSRLYGYAIPTDTGLVHGPGTADAALAWRYGLQPGGPHTDEPISGYPWRADTDYQTADAAAAADAWRYGHASRYHARLYAAAIIDAITAE